MKWSLASGVYLLSLSFINIIVYELMHFLVYSTAYYYGNNHLYEGEQHELSGSFDLFHVRTHNDPIPTEDNGFWKIHCGFFSYFEKSVTPIADCIWTLWVSLLPEDYSAIPGHHTSMFTVQCLSHTHVSHSVLAQCSAYFTQFKSKICSLNYCSFTFWIFT